MRPPGQVRRMALQTIEDLIVEARVLRQQQKPGATWRDVSNRLRALGVGTTTAQSTLKNLARAGVVEPVGKVTVPGLPRPLTAYAPVEGARAEPGWQVLGRAFAPRG